MWNRTELFDTCSVFPHVSESAVWTVRRSPSHVALFFQKHKVTPDMRRNKKPNGLRDRYIIINREFWNLRFKDEKRATCLLRFDISASARRSDTTTTCHLRHTPIFSLYRSLSLSLSNTMQSALSLSFSQTSLPLANRPLCSSNAAPSTTPRNLRFCGLRREAFGFSPSKQLTSRRFQIQSRRIEVSAAASSSAGNGALSKSFDYDLIIIGAGVGGHGAALHAVEKVLFLIRRTQVRLWFYALPILWIKLIWIHLWRICLIVESHALLYWDGEGMRSNIFFNMPV